MGMTGTAMVVVAGDSGLAGGPYSELYVMLLELVVVDSVMIHHDDMLKIVAGISVGCRIQSGFMIVNRR
jgi:hypothetical protein